MLITSTATLDGYRIVRYLGPLAVDVPVGASGSMLDNMKEGLGLRGSRQRTAIDRALEKAQDLLVQRAQAHGGNALIGFRVDVVRNGRGKTLLLASATQVVAEPVADGDALASVLGELVRVLERQPVAQSWPPAAAPSRRVAAPPVVHAPEIEPEPEPEYEAEPEAAFAPEFAPAPPQVVADADDDAPIPPFTDGFEPAVVAPRTDGSSARPPAPVAALAGVANGPRQTSP